MHTQLDDILPQVSSILSKGVKDGVETKQGNVHQRGVAAIVVQSVL